MAGTVKTLSLTIEGQPFIIRGEKWFVYDGTMASCPDWFLDFLETVQYIRSGGEFHFHELAHGYAVVSPHSLVIVDLSGATGPVVRTIRDIQHGQTGS